MKMYVLTVQNFATKRKIYSDLSNIKIKKTPPRWRLVMRA